MKSYFSTNRVLAVTIAAVAVATLFFACKKEVTNDAATNNEHDNSTLVVASHEAQMQGIYGDLFETAAIAAVSHNVAGNVRKSDYADYADITDCPSIIISSADPGVWPKQLSIDYGDACRDNYGVTRSGKVYISFSGFLFATGTRVEITLDGYKYNGIPVAGKNVISGISYNTTTGVQYTSDITDGLVTYADSLIVGYNSKKTVKQTAGAGTATPNDNVYSIEGTAAIKYVKGGPAGSADISTQTPLIKKGDCKWISQGQLKVAYNSLTAIIDYGNGICDANATITINGDKVREVTLK
ncbi:hypothetical protein [Chitinophaga qingshengii]|uniref:Lipoprotein n=1 Tax=Chitinophaga qingshengii TaxID=1569794 RepID=A0ABR7TL44_9BACT|nr:hypothetical protein [Chitinophaga qingshengii]MBC9931189.1 hypothetical protein [Chitinophaga qingshengii]